MARPIELELPARDPRIELQSRLEHAPVEHAEAILAAYEVLQGLHDRGVLEVLRGAIGSGDKILEIVTEAARLPEAVRGMRNFLVLMNVLGAIDPEALKIFARTIAPVLEAMRQQPESVGLWGLIKDFMGNEDFRRGLGTINKLVETFGRGLACDKKP